MKKKVINPWKRFASCISHIPQLLETLVENLYLYDQTVNSLGYIYRILVFKILKCICKYGKKVCVWQCTKAIIKLYWFPFFLIKFCFEIFYCLKVYLYAMRFTLLIITFHLTFILFS